jgi:hypothetical protein
VNSFGGYHLFGAVVVSLVFHWLGLSCSLSSGPAVFGWLLVIALYTLWGRWPRGSRALCQWGVCYGFEFGKIGLDVAVVTAPFA